MSESKLTPKQRLIGPNDYGKEQEIAFSQAELITLQGVLLDRIDRDARETTSQYFTHTELAKKLEYYISNQEEIRR